MDDKQKSSAIKLPPSPAPVLANLEDPEDVTWENIALFGDGSKIYHVNVRHSPFLLKRALVKAENAAEAKAIFLEQAKQRHAARAARQKANEWGRLTAERIQAALDEAMRANDAGELFWDIRLADDVKGDRTVTRRKVNQRWNGPQLAVTG